MSASAAFISPIRRQRSRNLLRDAERARPLPNGRGDEDERLPLSGKDEPPPGWLSEEWPGPAAMAKVERLRQQPAAE
jgi:hypothetical protein